jgi:hypothetical protein
MEEYIDPPAEDIIAKAKEVKDFEAKYGPTDLTRSWKSGVIVTSTVKMSGYSVKVFQTSLKIDNMKLTADILQELSMYINLNYEDDWYLQEKVNELKTKLYE